MNNLRSRVVSLQEYRLRRIYQYECAELAAASEQQKADSNKVKSAASMLLIAQHSKIWIGNRQWSFEDVTMALVCHPEFSSALGKLVDGDDEPLHALTNLVARQLACTILGIKPESIGVTA